MTKVKDKSRPGRKRVKLSCSCGKGFEYVGSLDNVRATVESFRERHGGPGHSVKEVRR